MTDELAPPPGDYPRAGTPATEPTDLRDVALRISLNVNGERLTRELHLADLGPADDLEARKQTTFPIMPFFAATAFGTDSILVIWWMACRKSGDPGLQYRNVLEQFPTYRALAAAEPELVRLDGDDVEEPTSPE